MSDTPTQIPAEEQLQCCLWQLGQYRQAIDTIVDLTRVTADDVEGGVDQRPALIRSIHEHALTASRVAKPERAPVSFLAHIALQIQFVKLARLLGVEIRDGTTYEQALEECRSRATAAAARADQYDAVLSLLDGAEDALQYAKTGAQFHNAKEDVERAMTLFRRALPVLRALAGRK